MTAIHVAADAGAAIAAYAGYGVVPDGSYDFILATSRSHDVVFVLDSGGVAIGDVAGATLGPNRHAIAGEAIPRFSKITTGTDGRWVVADTVGDSIHGIALMEAAAAGDEFLAYIPGGYKLGTVGAPEPGSGDQQNTAVALTASTWNDATYKRHTATTSGISHEIPTSFVSQAGKIFVVKDAGGNAGTNAITITTEGSETIDGAASIQITTDYAAVTLRSNGTNWETI